MKTGFFEVTPGNFSIMRLAFAWLILNATGMGWYALLDTGVGAAAAIFGTIASVATGLKIIQKEQEDKTELLNKETK
jgi:membrane associated rhomboid family serine protease